jgi:hypothetical protein
VRWSGGGRILEGAAHNYNSLAKCASFSFFHQPIVTVIAMPRNLVRTIERKAFCEHFKIQIFHSQNSLSPTLWEGG